MQDIQRDWNDKHEIILWNASLAGELDVGIPGRGWGSDFDGMTRVSPKISVIVSQYICSCTVLVIISLDWIVLYKLISALVTEICFNLKL